MRQLRVEIGEKELDRLIEKGGKMSLDEAVAFALGEDQDDAGGFESHISSEES